MTRPEEPDLRLLGLAARAGALIFGTDQVRRAVRAGRVRLAIVASDISENTTDKLRSLRDAPGVTVVMGPDRGALGALVGRGPLSVVGVMDATFASRMAPAARQDEGEGPARTGDR
jgi:ribosomal protein L7Ae-like RNA K-turn-binding protein